MFGNGSNLTRENFASTEKDFTGVDDGASFFATFCQGPTTTDSSSNTTATASSTVSSPTASPSQTQYPQAVALHSKLAIGGYFLDDAGYSDVAVLSIPYFIDGADTDILYEFQTVTREFLSAAKNNTKKKLVIDLRTNPGGTFDLAYDLFHQLFPQTTPYGK